MTGETPADLKPLADIARELDVSYSTLQSWRRAGRLKTWRTALGILASEGEVRRMLEPKPEEPKRN